VKDNARGKGEEKERKGEGIEKEEKGGITICQCKIPATASRREEKNKIKEKDVKKGLGAFSQILYSSQLGLL